MYKHVSNLIRETWVYNFFEMQKYVKYALDF